MLQADPKSSKQQAVAWAVPLLDHEPPLPQRPNCGKPELTLPSFGQQRRQPCHELPLKPEMLERVKGDTSEAGRDAGSGRLVAPSDFLRCACCKTERRLREQDIGHHDAAACQQHC